MDNINITFFLDEKSDTNNEANDNEIQKMLEEFNEDINSSEFEPWIIKNEMYNDNDMDLTYFITKAAYGDDSVYYEEEYSVKDLLKICNYYGIDKDIKASKCKKTDIISTLIYYESLLENTEIVKKRHRMWAYITELLNDNKMKKYIIF